MPYIQERDWNDLKERVALMESSLKKIEELLRNIKGQPPIIQGYAGKRLDINENIDGIKINKEITGIKARLDAHSI